MLITSTTFTTDYPRSVASLHTNAHLNLLFLSISEISKKSADMLEFIQQSECNYRLTQNHKHVTVVADRQFDLRYVFAPISASTS